MHKNPWEGIIVLGSCTIAQAAAKPSLFVPILLATQKVCEQVIVGERLDWIGSTLNLA